jgi:proteic killer suppression protein
VIKTFLHKGLEKFHNTGSKAGIQPKHADRLRNLLGALEAAARPGDLSAPNYELLPLKGDLAGHWAVKVSGNWRITFRFEGVDVILVDYQDYH